MGEDPIKAVLHTPKLSRRRGSASRPPAWPSSRPATPTGTHEESLAAVVSREVVARKASGAAARIRSWGIPDP